MKAKTVRGNGFRGVLDYALKKSGAEIVGGNMSGESPRELAAEFGSVRRLREEVEKPVWHCSLALPEGETVSADQWSRVANAFVTKMGMDPEENQFCVVRHHDTKHDHIHIICNRIKPDGELWNHRNDVYKAISITAELEKAFRMVETPGREAKTFAVPSFKKGEVEMYRKGQVPARIPVSKAIAEVTAAGPMDPVAFIQAMEARGIETVPNVSKTGRMNGFSFEYQGVALKGSDVGAAWKYLGEVVRYEPERDAERLRSIKKTSKRRGITGNRDADSPVTSGAGREGEGAPGGTADRVGDTVPGGSPDLFPVGAGTRGAADGVSGCYGGDEEAGEKAPLEKANPYSDGGDGVSGWGGVVDTLAILARGEQPDVQTDSHPGEVSSVAAEPSRNLRLQAWYKQAACLGAPQYRVTVIDRDAERTAEYNRRWNEKHPDEQPKNLDDTHAINLCRGKDGEEHLWSAEEVANNISTLEYYNVNRYDIYLTPMDPEHHHILVDDLTAEGVTHIKAHYAPCLIQTSSANNYQAIVRVPKAEISPDEQSAANLLIQRLNHLPDGCGGDRGISAPVHTFRMMGFHNKKPGRNNARTNIVFYRPGAVCPAAAAELEECRAEIRKKRATTAAAPRTTTEKEKSSVTAEIDFGSPTPFDAVFEREWSRQAGLARYQVARGKWGSVDDSTVDFRTCKELLRRGHGTEEIASSFKRKSPGLVRRHRAWEDYISRTLQAAGSALAEALEECVDEAAQHYDGR